MAQTRLGSGLNIKTEAGGEECVRGLRPGMILAEERAGVGGCTHLLRSISFRKLGFRCLETSV